MNTPSEEMKVVELRAALKTKGLPTNGRKKGLLQRYNSEDTTKLIIKEMDNINHTKQKKRIFIEIQILSTTMENNHGIIQEVEQLLKYAQNENLRNATVREKIVKHIDRKDEGEKPLTSPDAIKLRCKSILDSHIDVNRFCTILRRENKNLRNKSKKKLDLFSLLPENLIVCHILPLFCKVKHQDSKTDNYNEVTVLKNVITLHDSISVFNCFGKTKKSFTFIREHDTLENEPSISLRKTYHHLMCVKKYGYTPTLLKLCQTNTITVSEAKLLIELKGTNNNFFEVGLNCNSNEVGKYLVSNLNCGNKVDFLLGKLEKKYGNPPLMTGCKSKNGMKLEDVKLLIEICKVNVSTVDKIGNSASYYAGIRNHENIGKYLILHGGETDQFEKGKSETECKKCNQDRDEECKTCKVPLCLGCHKDNFSDECCMKYFCNDCVALIENDSGYVYCADCSTKCDYCGEYYLTEDFEECHESACGNIVCPSESCTKYSEYAEEEKCCRECSERCHGAVINGRNHPCGKYTNKLIYKSIWGVVSRAGLCEDCFYEHGGEDY